MEDHEGAAHEPNASPTWSDDIAEEVRQARQRCNADPGPTGEAVVQHDAWGDSDSDTHSDTHSTPPAVRHREAMEDAARYFAQHPPPQSPGSASDAPVSTPSQKDSTQSDDTDDEVTPPRHATPMATGD